MQVFDPLWVPVLTHYDDDAGLDTARTASHLRHLTPSVRQYLVAGTTGDGWEMSDAVLTDWLDVLRDPATVSPQHQVLIGAFAATTDAVIARARHLEACIAERPLVAGFAGLTICAPVDAQASQDAIAEHIEAILAATSSPIAVYQLPQITGCEIAPETFARLAQAHPRIVLFKDTSGTDQVVRALHQAGAVCWLRGAEGDYQQHLKPLGLYDGFLLSTANGFAPQLRKIINDVAAGASAQAVTQSAQLTQLVQALFAHAADCQIANPFANVNRAVDHVFAYGKAWHAAPLPVLVNGERLPREFLAGVAERLEQAGFAIDTGYCDSAAVA